MRIEKATGSHLTTDSETQIGQYQKLIDSLRSVDRKLNKKISDISGARLFFVACTIYCLFLDLRTSLFWWLALGVLSAGFISLVAYHKYLNRKAVETNQLIKLNIEAIARINRSWKKIQRRVFSSISNPILTDLSITGYCSLIELIGEVKTQNGYRKFENWIICVPTHSEILKRQNAVKELESQLSLRQDLYRLFSIGWSQESNFTSQNIHNSMSPYWVVLLLCLISITCIVLVFSNFNIYPLLILPITLNTVYSFVYKRNHESIVNGLEGKRKEVSSFFKIINLLKNQNFSSELLEWHKNILAGDESSALTEIKKLDNLLGWWYVRTSPIIFMILQSLFLIDFHLIRRLQNWKSRNTESLPIWIDSLSEIEVLAAVSGLAHDNPGWSYPLISSDFTNLRFKDIGHPLIFSQNRIGNDFEIHEKSKLTMITGSNMSGKSTFLKSLGLNILLSRLGAPVCAQEASFPPIGLSTCFSSNDSLSEGSSLYYSELTRLASVVADIEEGVKKGIRYLFILDEILSGTNVKDRFRGTSIILKHLTSMDSYGLVSTHDLSLLGLKDYGIPFSTNYFSEKLIRRDNELIMYFDFKLKNGIQTDSNAITLLSHLIPSLQGNNIPSIDY